MPKSTAPKLTELAIALADLQAAIAGLEQPYEPKTEAAAYELEEWKEHLAQVHGAVLAYTRAVVAHLSDVTPTKIEDHTPSLAVAIEEHDPALLSDAMADVTGEIQNAANRIREAA